MYSYFRDTTLARRAKGKAQQLGTDLQAGTFCRVVIDLQADLIRFFDEINDASCFDETLRFPHGQNTGAAEALKNLRETLFLRGVDEKDVAVSRLRQETYLFDYKRAVIDGFSANRPFEVIAKGVFAQNADNKGRGRLGKGFQRPFDEFRKIEKEDSP